MSVRRASISALTQLTAAGLTTVSMILASRRGLFLDIGGYSAGSAATALAAVLFGSGTTLNYLTGTDTARRAVIRVRMTMVLPGLLLATLVSTGVSLLTPHISSHSVFFGGCFVVFSNLGELPSATLQRELRTRSILGATLIGRLLTLGIVLAGGLFSFAAMTGMALTFVILSFRCWRSLPFSNDMPLRQSIRLAFTGSTSGIALSDAVNQKTPFLIAPVAFDNGTFSGQFSTLASGQQSLLTVIVAPLYSAMANAASQGRGPWVQKLERLALVAALATALLGAALATPFLNLMGIPTERDVWWWLLIAGLPLATWNRLKQYQLMGIGQVRKASKLIGSIGATCLAICLLSWVWMPDLVAAAPIASELVGALLGALLGWTTKVLPKTDS